MARMTIKKKESSVRILLLLACSVMFANSARADIVLSVGNQNLNRDSGVLVIDLLARTNTPDAGNKEDRFAISPTLTLTGGGAFAENNNGFDFSSADPQPTEKRTGIIGAPGMIGENNVFGGSGGGTFFVFDTSDPTVSYLSIQFKDKQPVTVSDQLLLQLTVNVNGLAPGNYNINVKEGDKVVNSNLGFSISAVPEPGSVLLLSSLGIAVGGWYRVRRKK